jgi:hypothetical protein
MQDGFEDNITRLTTGPATGQVLTAGTPPAHTGHPGTTGTVVPAWLAEMSTREGSARTRASRGLVSHDQADRSLGRSHRRRGR